TGTAMAPVVYGSELVPLAERRAERQPLGGWCLRAQLGPSVDRLGQGHGDAAAGGQFEGGAPTSASSSRGRPASRSWSMEVLCSSISAAPARRFSMEANAP